MYRKHSEVLYADFLVNTCNSRIKNIIQNKLALYEDFLDTSVNSKFPIFKGVRTNRDVIWPSHSFGITRKNYMHWCRLITMLYCRHWYQSRYFLWWNFPRWKMMLWCEGNLFLYVFVISSFIIGRLTNCETVRNPKHYLNILKNIRTYLRSTHRIIVLATIA